MTSKMLRAGVATGSSGCCVIHPIVVGDVILYIRGC